MDYFQGVVTEFLRADRAVFVNTECLLQLASGHAPVKGRHWYCDAVAVNFRESSVSLCEVTYASTVQALVKRLEAWATHWPQLRSAIVRDCCVPSNWHVHPWLFIPEDRHPTLTRRLATIKGIGEHARQMPVPKVTYLEAVTPWKYSNWHRKPSEGDGAAHHVVVPTR